MLVGPSQSCEPPLQMLAGPSLAETKRQATQLTQAAAKRRDLQVDKVEPQQWSWIAVAQASQLPQVVPQDVARPFASLGLPQPQVQAQALAGRCAAACNACPPRDGLAASQSDLIKRIIIIKL
jgi:hypothetical protein